MSEHGMEETVAARIVAAFKRHGAPLSDDQLNVVHLAARSSIATHEAWRRRNKRKERIVALADREELVAEWRSALGTDE